MAIAVSVVSNNRPFTFNYRTLIKEIAKTISNVELITKKHTASVVLVDEQTIHDINKRYRLADAPTDVISFAMSDGKNELESDLGDIFICVEKVFDQAKEYGHSIKRELAFLVTHGFYHLLGYDHHEETAEKLMTEKQENILTILDIKRS